MIGIDATDVYLQDPALGGARARVPRAEFLRRWHGRDTGRPVHRPGIVFAAGEPAARAPRYRFVLPP